jgi:prolyl oligopeptidase
MVITMNLLSARTISTAGLTFLIACSSPDEASPEIMMTEELVQVANTVAAEPDMAADEDPFIWLEEVEGSEALAWAEQQNNLSIPRLQGDPRFTEIRTEIEAILTSDDRIPSGSLVDGSVYNFWQDADHVRGILRKASLESYAGDSPAWETVLDIDALASLENINWVYKGKNCLPSNSDRCLISLSDGGKDAVVVREFNLAAKSFVDGGFYVEEAKTNVAWVDSNTLIVGTDFGEGSLTTSGYARSLRLWRRGSTLADAEQLIEVENEDMVVSPVTVNVDGEELSLVVRRPDFYTEESWLVTEQGTLAKLPLPIDANMQGVLGEQALILLRSDWQQEDGTIFSAGSLVSMNLQMSISAQAPIDLRTVLDPEANNQLDAISSVATSRDAVYVTVLKDVVGSLLKATASEAGWKITDIELPANGAIQIVSADDYSDTLLVNYESFLVPDTLFLIEGDSSPRPIKALQPRFEADDYVTEQHFAISADGTRIPYFVVRCADTLMDGSTPVEMTAYGGFELSRTPTYVSALDQAWLTRGGAYVLANIRGGGEYGPKWHQTALLENRQRVFDDFIAVAEDIIDSGLTSSERLGIRGGSNGGLLVTAVMVQRPELYKAIISAVPLIDMLRYHKLLAGASWMAEYGNPDIAEHRAFISEYSPYQLVSANERYPDIFLWTNLKDDRVHPGHARKMAARMLEQGHDVIYFESSEGGHGGGANLNQLAVTSAMQVVYFLQQLVD